MSDMSGKVALVTGAASGIGRATALAFAAAGAKVAAVDVQADRAAETVAQIAAAGGEAIDIECDVSQPAQVAHMVQQTVEAFGRLDYAFNNAGIEGTPASTVECSEDNWDRTIAVNLKGIWLCMRHEIPQMLENGGAIVNCSSVAGLVGIEGVPAYVASKHGVNGLTKTAALEYGTQGVRVNAVCPGAIQTPMLERFTQGDAEAEAQMEAQEPIGRIGRPEEVASAVLYLCSEEAGFITGAVIPVDGGWVAR